MTTSDGQETVDGFTERVRSRSAELDERINAFEQRLKEASDEARAAFEPMAERLRSSWQALRSQMGTTAENPLEPLTRDLERGLSQLQSQVEAGQAGLEAEMADTRQSYRDALRQQLEAWRAGVEHLQVQAALAEKEARSELNELVERAENAYLAARQQLARAEEDTAETLDVLRDGARRVLDDLEAAMEAGWNRFRSARTG
jgi:DNA anti-recombination protein RmuC